MNKYERKPEKEIDLHGMTTGEAEALLSDVIGSGNFSHIRVITGKGLHSKQGPVLKTFVQDFLKKRGIRFSQSKINEGGEGSLEVFFESKM
jgi:DNA-nicking Smr family endonuclease